MTFEEDLTKRRIDVIAFAAGEPDRFAEWQQMYAQMHPNSFYISVKMVLNDVRRRFWLAEAAKPVVTATEVPAKPATRRVSIPGTPKPAETPVITPEPAEQKPATPSVGKGRAVIRKPISTNQEAPVNPETSVLPVSSEEPTEVPKAPRARPVIRKPTPAPETSDAPVAENNTGVQDGTNSEIPFHTNPNPEAESVSKPPRPRPVFKKTGATGNPVEQPVASKIPDPEPVSDIAPDLSEAVELKSPRPRPVFKRPTANLNSAEQTAGEPASTAPAPAESLPVKEVPGQTVENPVPNNTDLPAAKPPRPRPIIKRPADTPDSMPEQAAAPVSMQQQPVVSENKPDLPVEEPPKPSRPRPVFKRPTKPEGE